MIGLVSFWRFSYSFLVSWTCNGFLRIPSELILTVLPPCFAVFIVIPITDFGCCTFPDKIFSLCYRVRRRTGATRMDTLRPAFLSAIRAEPEPSRNDLVLPENLENLFEHGHGHRSPPSPVQHESGSRGLYSPEKIQPWLQQRIEMTRAGTFRSVSLPTEPEPFPRHQSCPKSFWYLDNCFVLAPPFPRFNMLLVHDGCNLHKRYGSGCSNTR